MHRVKAVTIFAHDLSRLHGLRISGDILRPNYFVASLAMLLTSTAAAVAQEAYVYDYMPNTGVYAYDASSSGKLTAIKGSPFQVAGQMVGTNGSYFVSADSTTVYAYAVESNGAIGKLVSQIDTQKYSGSQCGTMGFPSPSAGYYDSPAGEYNHTGQDVYVLLSGNEDQYGDLVCQSYQTYSISKSGSLTFKGSTEFAEDGYSTEGLPTLTGNGEFGFNWLYSDFSGDPCSSILGLFKGESGGVLDYQDDNVNTPPAAPDGDSWVLTALTDDPTDHIAMSMYTTTDPDCNDGPTFGPDKLVSYTVDNQGNLTTTNTYEEMPSLPAGTYTGLMKLDQSGKILAVAAGTGVAFYRFNGTAPISAITGVIGESGEITRMGWDSDDHLYAQNEESGRLHVYAATTSGAKELSGSPTVIPYNNTYSSIIVRTK
jgi:hypothetical protein